MKFKEIKPGMVIHCPKEEDARVLLEYLGNHRYWWQDGKVLDDKLMFNHIKDNYKDNYDFCFKLGIRKDDLSGTVIMTSREGEGAITEFSDLIEPEFNTPNASSNALNDKSNAQMSAVEVLEWLNHFVSYDDYGGVFERLHDEYGDEYGFTDLVSEYTPEEIVSIITAYEAAKKAPKPVEVEWVKLCRIIQIQIGSGIKKVVYEVELREDVDAHIQTEETLKDYIAEHEGRYIAVIENVCRVKEDK